MYKARDKPLCEIEFTTHFYKKRNRADIVNDDIMCFDIETSSAFRHQGSAAIEPFTGKDQSYYRECEKYSLCYIWQFSINDNIFWGRTLEEFVDFLHELEFYEPHKKIIYVHNFAYEFQFLVNVMNFDYVFARNPRKPIFADYGTYQFRCSYFLTRMSLDTWAHEKQLPVQKLVGNLDYTKLRTPRTELTPDELDYCFHDVLVMYYGLSQYKEKYSHVIDIPYTQTGEVRREVIKRMNVPEEMRYRKKCIALIPDSLDEYRRQIRVFLGGYTHASFLYANRIIENVDSYDIASSYPTVMCLEKYPMTRFEKVEPREKYFDTDKWCFIIEFEAYSVRSELFNTYLSFSKCDAIKNYRCDNGRVLKADYVKLTMTNVDFELFRQCYEFSDLTIIDFRVAYAGYLSDTFVKYVLELYNNKTQFKGIDEYAATYVQSKQFINSMYGMMVTRTITDSINYNDGWTKEPLNNARFIEKITSEKKKLSKTFSAFQFGAWVTAYARRNLWRGIINLDARVIYCDTDSIKLKSGDSSFFEHYNADIEKRENERAVMLGIDPSAFAPLDRFGVSHRMGIYDYEERYDKFKTLGAKKYCYEKDGALHMTVSGVRKKAVSQIHSLDEFNDGLVFDVEHAGKLLMTYVDDMQPVVWNQGKSDEFKSTYTHGIVAQPTTYSLGITPEYLDLILSNMRGETEILKHETEIL